MKKKFTEKEANTELEKGYGKAKGLLENEDQIERFLQRLEHKLKTIPIAGDKLANVPVLASLVKSYVNKEYTDIPIGSVVSIVSALVYFVSPIDIVPDSIPVIGYFDDATVIAACWKLVESDVKEYNKWRKDNNKIIDL